jgi:small GTP-binding protein
MYNIILLGDPRVGKSSFMHRVCTDTFSSSYISTIAKDFQIYKSDYIIHDTSGSERFRAIAEVYYKYADGAIIIFDVTNESTFHSIEKWRARILDKVRQNIPIIVIGNKIDSPNNHKRQSKIEYISCKNGNIDIEAFLSSLTCNPEISRNIIDRRCPSCCSF